MSLRREEALALLLRCGSEVRDAIRDIAYALVLEGHEDAVYAAIRRWQAEYQVINETVESAK